jgi:LysM repeat protein
MTRETKIGLLVGLAFIIVVAILLSDPVNNANEPPAAIADTINNVRQSTMVPAASAPANPGTTAIITPNRTPIHEQILTPTEAAQQTAQNEIHISAANPPLKPIITTPNQDDSLNMQQASAGQENAIVPPTPPGHPDALQEAAAKQGEKIVRADQPDQDSPGAASGQDDPPTPAAPAASKQHYTAQSGDSVSKMAARLMGANTKANRAAIIAANPSLKQNPDRVIVGAAYVIPAAAASPAPSDTDAQTPAPSDVAQAPAPDKLPTRWYVVKPNDSLWRIATNEVGDSAAVAEIESLNKDVLKGSQTLQANMRLRLPPKTVASAD